MTAIDATTEPDLSIQLFHPITLTGGPRSHLVTLMWRRRCTMHTRSETPT
jgi:hypothetical protein